MLSSPNARRAVFATSFLLAFSIACSSGSGTTTPPPPPPPPPGGSSNPVTPGDVTTYHGDYSRDGQNTAETILTRASVKTSFGKIGALPVDGLVYAQPLTMSGVKTPSDGQTHNLVFIATEHDSVYAYDVDSIKPGSTPTLVWQTSFLSESSTGATADAASTATRLSKKLSLCSSATCSAVDVAKVTTASIVKPQAIYTKDNITDSVLKAKSIPTAGASTSSKGASAQTASAETTAPVSTGEVTAPNISPEIGITATPVIDEVNGVIYVTAMTQETDTTTSSPIYHWKLHALNVTDGTEFSAASPVEITATASGSGSTLNPGTQTLANPNNSNEVVFDPLRALSRSGLVLYNNTIYIAFSSFNDQEPSHGWVLAYPANGGLLSPNPSGTWISSPNSGDGNIWMAGGAPTVDSSGNLYFATSNSDVLYQTNEYADSVVRLSTSGGSLQFQDYFTPDDFATLSSADLDLGSGGVLNFPDQPGTIPHLIAAGGKEGTIYLLNRDQLGPNDGEAVQELIKVLPGGHAGGPGIYGTPSFFQGNFYIIGAGDTLRSIPLQNGLLNWNAMTASTVPLGTNALGPGKNVTPGLRGATATISANGSADGIIWYMDASAYSYRWAPGITTAVPAVTAGPPILYAYSTDDVTTPLYASNNTLRDDAAGCPASAPGVPGTGAGCAVKFAVPTVSHGKVYVGTDTEVTVYGILSGSTGSNEIAAANAADTRLAVTPNSAITLSGAGIAGLNVTAADVASGSVSVKVGGVAATIVSANAGTITAVTPKNLTVSSPTTSVQVTKNGKEPLEQTVPVAASMPAIVPHGSFADAQVIYSDKRREDFPGPTGTLEMKNYIQGLPRTDLTQYNAATGAYEAVPISLSKGKYAYLAFKAKGLGNAAGMMSIPISADPSVPRVSMASVPVKIGNTTFTGVASPNIDGAGTDVIVLADPLPKSFKNTGATPINQAVELGVPTPKGLKPIPAPLVQFQE